MEFGQRETLKESFLDQTDQKTIFFFLRSYLFIHERHRDRERQDTDRGRSRLPAGSLMKDSIPGLQDQALG